MRIAERGNRELRPTTIIPNYLDFSNGSALISTGSTKVLCTANISETVPTFLSGSNKGWITAEYNMLPGSTNQRIPRSSLHKGRTKEIQRLIGRALRSSLDLTSIGEMSIHIDCDVLQADGGTRTAAVTGSFVALYLALNELTNDNLIDSIPDFTFVAATSVGVLQDSLLLDLCYDEDARADVDFNIVMSENQEIIELQGSAEGQRFTKNTVNQIIDIASEGISDLIKIQKMALKIS